MRYSWTNVKIFIKRPVSRGVVLGFPGTREALMFSSPSSHRWSQPPVEFPRHRPKKEGIEVVKMEKISLKDGKENVNLTCRHKIREEELYIQDGSFSDIILVGY
jgi:hypothetical protein